MRTSKNWLNRRALRYGAAAIAALIAVIYFLIGLRVLIVLDGDGNQIFGLFASVAFAFGAGLLLATDRRILWTLGAILQVFVIVTYFNLASQRTPTFEVWGLLLRAIQLPLLAALAYLALRAPLAERAAANQTPG